jgi:hypothetical protein
LAIFDTIRRFVAQARFLGSESHVCGATPFGGDFRASRDAERAALRPPPEARKSDVKDEDEEEKGFFEEVEEVFPL